MLSVNSLTRHCSLALRRTLALRENSELVGNCLKVTVLLFHPTQNEENKDRTAGCTDPQGFNVPGEQCQYNLRSW